MTLRASSAYHITPSQDLQAPFVQSPRKIFAVKRLLPGHWHKTLCGSGNIYWNFSANDNIGRYIERRHDSSEISF